MKLEDSANGKPDFKEFFLGSSSGNFVTMVLDYLHLHLITQKGELLKAYFKNNDFKNSKQKFILKL